MKKIILILAIIFMAIGAKAQSTIQSEDGKYPVYCDLKAYNFWGVGKVKVMLDMGAVSNGGGSFESLYDEDGKQIKFNTVMAAVNYMAKKGWILDKTYYVTEGQVPRTAKSRHDRFITSWATRFATSARRE